jgi:prepilin-type N-terminal cleavage/methylation domain-containing protein
MYPKANMMVVCRQFGFSMIELLVVLVITGLLAAVAGPNLFAALNASQRADDISKVRGVLPSIALHATLLQQQIIIDSEAQINTFLSEPIGLKMLFEPALLIQKNGYCHMSKLSIINQSDVTM